MAKIHLLSALRVERERRPGRHSDLGGFRTVLALGVLFLHSFHEIGIEYPQLPWVAGFIAISGYLVTGSMERSAGYAHFAWKRLLRVGPAFVLSFVLVATLGESIWDALIQWASLGQLITGPNGSLWSLSTEEILYCLLAIAFASGLYASKHRAAKSLVIILAVVAIIGLSPWTPPRRFLVVGMSFIWGSLLYVVREKIIWSAAAGVLCLFGAFIVRLFALDLAPTAYALVNAPLIAYAMISLALHAPPLFANYRGQVGDPSFGIYVYHMPVLLWLKSHSISGVMLPLATFIIVGTLGLLSWHLIEKRALSLKNVFVSKSSSSQSSIEQAARATQ